MFSLYSHHPCRIVWNYYECKLCALVSEKTEPTSRVHKDFAEAMQKWNFGCQQWQINLELARECVHYLTNRNTNLDTCFKPSLFKMGERVCPVQHGVMGTLFAMLFPSFYTF